MKKHYNQPEVNVASIALESMILAGSPGPVFNGDSNGGDPIGGGDAGQGI